MRVTMRDVRVGLIALLSVMALGLVSTVVSVAAAAARTSVLIMGGSGDPLTTDQDGLPFIRDYTSKVVGNYVIPSASRPGSGIPGGPYNAVAVITPAQFNSGEPGDTSLTFDDSVAAGAGKLATCIESGDECDINEDLGSDRPAPGDNLVVFGYSQSAAIATLEKARLAALYPYGEGPDVSFILTANGNRPNGGFLARGPKGVTIPLGTPGGGVTFNGSTPTDTQYSTIDVAIQYDGWADQPINPANLLAVANANAGQRLLHPHYADYSLGSPGIIDQGQYGDTRYLMIPTDTLPLLYELSQTPIVGSFLADVLDAPLRVLVESGYDRTSSPGEPKPWTLVPAKDPLKTAADFLVAIPTGWDNAIEDVNGTRPFGTVRPGPFGVGGPDVDYLDPDEDLTKEASKGTELADDSSVKATLVSRLTDATEAEADAVTAKIGAVTEKTQAKVTTLTKPRLQAADEAGDEADAEPSEPSESSESEPSGSETPETSDTKKPTTVAKDSGSEDKAVTKPADAKPEPKEKSEGTSASKRGRHSSGLTAKPSDKESAPKHRAPDSDTASAKPSREKNSAPKHAAGDHNDRQTKPRAAHGAAAKDAGKQDKQAASAAKK
ncbi:PE-PPE domain-containing protein [Mycolicibacterium smegmatis]|uniref:PE-PPE domain-containing protein n=1 Tax=Mycolicibacterium smegmatis TaxID=1772 RepID=UPI0005D93AEB|nr:PE-PPE domain-containing protein [Mycolicibacterium smegmatis]MDF1897518.1 PE-PPE domain-containing protein [Mycolicibacterium smegmatis]MDF1904039.1 PE-PPE domain-containing protein [Mycolicibacterium smegmatis]MDF1917084.1 PE-PPE domain-containing protein [Mycolicibacterium smegmatis]MDF1922458.1 PE-PPE domain-containing protein [Mycolicibacterium smegmatis]UGT74837.1 PE-PPE domain-containing protein [Mycolicibacterium smegmatis]